jgi:CelD/BcsL family acetyltransferase involved in cellulose biosynthesis
VTVFHGRTIPARLPAWREWIGEVGHGSPSLDARWLLILARGLKHEPYCLEATADGKTAGLLPLAFVHSPLFGRFLVGLPYLNTGGVLAENHDVARRLVSRAVDLANLLDVRYLELRHEKALSHPALAHQLTTKVHMRLPLPASPDDLWKAFDPKVRNQIRKAEKQDLSVHWGSHDLLGDFYCVFAHNMRDLGTPVFPRRLFASILTEFQGSGGGKRGQDPFVQSTRRAVPAKGSCPLFPPRSAPEAELCVARLGDRPVAAAILVHGRGVTEVPSASSLRQFNKSNANMLMYWHLLQRAIEKGQHTFDFGRSSPESNTYRFKKQWGAQPEPAVWQYCVRKGNVADMRLESGKYNRLVAMWQRLPVWLTKIIGPPIVRGIP